jgi:threonine synthase
VAAYCAAAGISCEIFVPASTSPGKLAQIRMYGAHLNLVPGTREDTSHAVWNAAQSIFYASHIWNPFFFHGTKTWAYEVCEQLGWRAPDSIVIPAGHGTLLLGAYIGFSELLQAGIINKIPRIIAVQSANCAPLYAAYKADADQPLVVQGEHTLAEGIAIAAPNRGRQILKAVRSSQGNFLAVSEDEILDTLKEIAGKGFYIEPTSAAVIAGLKRYLLTCPSNELVVSTFTGHGLKSTEKLLKIAEN